MQIVSKELGQKICNKSFLSTVKQIKQYYLELFGDFSSSSFADPLHKLLKLKKMNKKR